MYQSENDLADKVADKLWHRMNAQQMTVKAVPITITVLR